MFSTPRYGLVLVKGVVLWGSAVGLGLACGATVPDMAGFTGVVNQDCRWDELWVRANPVVTACITSVSVCGMVVAELICCLRLLVRFEGLLCYEVTCFCSGYLV